MSKKEDFDVVIIGSGVSGLVAGCYLQKAGLKVAILEAREEAGGGRMAHELMRPGSPVQSCVWGDIDYMMPHQLNLGLDRYGYQEIELATEWPYGQLYPDGTCLVANWYDYHKTAEKIRRFSEKDAKKMLEMGDYMSEPYDERVSRAVKLTELFFIEPWTWENFDKLVDIVAPLLLFDDPYELTDLNGFGMVDLMFESEQMKVYIAQSLIYGSVLMPFNTGGGSSIGTLLACMGGVFFSHPRHGCHSMAHVYIRCFRALGGKLFNSCPVKKIIVAGGEVKGVILDDHAAFPGREITAGKVVSNINPRYTFCELVGEEHVGRRVIQQLKTNWKGDGQLFYVNWLLKDRPRYTAEKFDSDIVNILGGAMGVQTLDEVIYASAHKTAGRVPRKPVQGFAASHPDDPTQRGQFNAGWDVPYSVCDKGGPEIWDDEDFRRDLVEQAIDIWEAHAPGFRKDLIDYWVDTPLDHQRLNPNYINGCELGGSYGAPQLWYGNRPGAEGFDKGGLITPIKNLYGCAGAGFSASTGGNGYRVANMIAEELGIRNQPWWTHGVGEYIGKKYIHKTYVPLKPTSILDKE